jgi:putative Mg2+ transporter-C (MgtC) family protein
MRWLPTGTDVALTLQLALAGTLAGIVGWQRHRVGRPAGVRTHALVAMAAASFAFAGMYGFGTLGGLGPPEARDPTRIAAQVVTGVGFLGAGTIFWAEHSVFGLTTAATLWFAAGIGVLVAGGLVWIAALSTTLVFVLFVIVGRVEDRRDLSGADRSLKA